MTVNRFLGTSFVFAIPIIIALLLNETIVRTLPNEYTIKINFFERQLNKIDFLILGSSHALRGINPHVISAGTAFNLAMVSQSLELDHRLLFKYKDQMPRLRCVILSVSHFTLSQTLLEGELKERLPYYKHFYHLELPELKPSSPDYYMVQFAVGFIGTAGRIMRLIKNESLTRTDSLGWMRWEGKQSMDKNSFSKDAVLAAQRHENNSFDFQRNVALLKKIIKWGEENGIKIILINTPKTSWYVENLSEAKSDSIESTIDEITSGTKTKYLDFERHPNFDSSDFWNSDHLNEKGATKLSLLLDEELKK